MSELPYLEGQDKVNYERLWTDHRMAGNVNWNLYRSTHKLSLHEGRALVAWTLAEGAPRVDKVLRLTSTKLSVKDGLSLWLAGNDGHNLQVTADPVELLPGIFLWVPAFSDIRFAPMRYDEPDSPRQLSVPLMCKTRSRSDAPQEGHVYITPMKEFVRAWPNVTI